LAINLDLGQILNRPSWHVATTREIAEAASIPFGQLSNWVVRRQRQFPLPEPRQLYRLDRNARVFRVDKVTEWMSGVPALEQAVRYLDASGLSPMNSSDADIFEYIAFLERLRIFTHRWPPRDLEAYLNTLMKK
jgi:hypothetical protein